MAIINRETWASVRSKLNVVLAAVGNFVTLTGSETLTNKTLTSPVLTTPQINDTSADHQYVVAVSELVADRIVTLPLLGAGDTFVFEAHTQTLTNKTLTSPVISSPTGLVKADVGLSNVDNTSDVNKPVSTAQATADALVASTAATNLTNGLSNKQAINSADTLNWTVLPDNAAKTINQITQNKTLFWSVPGAPIAYTFNDAGTTFPIGGEIIVFNGTGGQDITLTAAGGVTIIYNGALTSTVAATKMARLLRVALNLWIRIS